MKKIFGFAILGALGVALIGSSLISPASFASDTPDDEIIDTVVLSVSQPTCSFMTTADASAENGSYSATSAVAGEVSFSNNGIRDFNIACNDVTGYQVKAYAENLSLSSGGAEITFKNYAAYTAATDAEKATGIWTAQITNGGDTDAVFGADAEHALVIKSTTGISANDGDLLSVQYRAYIGSSVPAGTYTGQAVYQLIMNISAGD